MTQTTLKTTPLHSYHLDHGAQMVDYAGWEMPIRYTGTIKEEHEQCRRSGGLFDVSHMGRLMLKGLHARRVLERVCSRRIGDMQEGQCRYSLVCNERGGVMDDVIVNRMDTDEFMVVCNGANREKIVNHIRGVIDERGFKVKFEDRTEKTAMVAIQGPRVMDLIGRVSSEVPTLKKFRFTVKNLMILKLIVARTGYTGEDGVEIILPANAVGMALKLLLKDVDNDPDQKLLAPCGLGARDTLRLEAGLPLYGHELGEAISALAVGMPFAMNLDKSEANEGETFIGQEALVAEQERGGPGIRLVGLVIDSKRTARQDMRVLDGETDVGFVTSGCASPTLGASIAMAYVSDAHSAVGTKLRVDAQKAVLDAEVVALPFYKASKKG